VSPQAVLRPLDGLGTVELAHWQALADAAIEPNPFFRPALALAAHHHLGDTRAALAVVEGAEGWLACLPVVRRRAWRRLTGPCLSSWGHVHGFLDTPLVHPRAGHGAVAALMQALLAQPVAFVVLPLLGGGGVAHSLEAGLREHGARPVRYMDAERAALVRRAEPTYLSGALNAKRRRELRRQWRLMQQEIGAPLAVVDRSTDPAAYATFMELEASGWKGKSGTAFASDPGQRAFAREAMTTLAGEGRLELLSLEGGGGSVAMKCNFRDGGVTFCFKIAHDEALARFSPGIQLEIGYVERFHAAARDTLVDSCAVPANAMINRLWPDRRRVVTLIAPVPGPRGALAGAQARAMIALRARLGRVG
jgi:CelD/BcsL family acetyltransferase involved in cellulose biosynthesis